VERQSSSMERETVIRRLSLDQAAADRAAGSDAHETVGGRRRYAARRRLCPRAAAQSTTRVTLVWPKVDEWKFFRNSHAANRFCRVYKVPRVEQRTELKIA
jgi:hypothetical protein